jgi:hypothetical protein
MVKKFTDIMEELKISDPASYEEIEAIKKSWGGKRAGAGRSKADTRKKTVTKRLNEQTIVKIKEYSKAKNINETKALEELIEYGYKYANL